MAREGYLVNAGEDTIHAGVIKPETPKQKRQNWWFYHKGPLIVIVLAAALVVSISFSIFSKVQPDYTVALITSYTMSSSGLEELENCIAAYADDRNGDGKVTVSVVNYVFSSSAMSSPQQAEALQASLVRFMADVAMNDAMLFLHDETGFHMVQENFGGFFQYTDGTPMPEDATDFENAMRPWSDFSAFSNFTPQVPEDESYTSEVLSELYGRLRVSLRAPTPSIEKDEKDLDYWEDCETLYHRLEEGK